MNTSPESVLIRVNTCSNPVLIQVCEQCVNVHTQTLPGGLVRVGGVVWVGGMVRVGGMMREGGMVGVGGMVRAVAVGGMVRVGVWHGAGRRHRGGSTWRGHGHAQRRSCPPIDHDVRRGQPHVAASPVEDHVRDGVHELLEQGEERVGLPAPVGLPGRGRRAVRRERSRLRT